jgi:hypothetical protein
MKYEEIKTILENALDTFPNSEFHMGYTAKEIHKKALDFIVSQHREINKLKALKNPKYLYQGWGKGKDE